MPEGNCAIARTLDSAQRILRERGCRAISVKLTRPPRGQPAGPLRVVRERKTGEGIELVAAFSTPLPERHGSDG